MKNYWNAYPLKMVGTGCRETSVPTNLRCVQFLNSEDLNLHKTFMFFKCVRSKTLPTVKTVHNIRDR